MIIALTQKGPDKTISEDIIVAGHEILCDSEHCSPLPEQGFICVIDGAGGIPGGEKASRFLAERFAEIQNDPKTVSELTTLLKEINNRLITYALGTPDVRMAAALTGIVQTDGSRLLFHAGNTRAFLMQGSYLRQLTDDHTLRQRLLHIGQAERAAQADPNELIGCFGGGSSRFLSVLTVSALPEYQTLLLTSDGIHDHLTLDCMEEILSLDLSDNDKCRLLLKKARQNGSRDDASIMVIRK